MGAWGHGSFENDDAADFVADVTEGSDLDRVRSTLDAVATGTGYLDAPDASEAIAAAEIVAAILGRASPAAIEEEGLLAWAGQFSAEDGNALAGVANAALTRILGEASELRELWEEADEFDDWRASVEALRDLLPG